MPRHGSSSRTVALDEKDRRCRCVCTPHMPYPPRGEVALTSGGARRGPDPARALRHAPAPAREQRSSSSAAGGLQADGPVLTSRFSFPVQHSRGRTLRQLLGMRRLPWGVAKVLPTGEVKSCAQRAVADFAPEMVLLSRGLAAGELGRHVAAELDVPLVYRSHNVEHLYLHRQAHASRSVRNRVAWRLATWGLEAYELALMRSSRLVLDISLDDLEFWRGRGVSNMASLPPCPSWRWAALRPRRSRPGALRR